MDWFRERAGYSVKKSFCWEGDHSWDCPAHRARSVWEGGKREKCIFQMIQHAQFVSVSGKTGMKEKVAEAKRT